MPGFFGNPFERMGGQPELPPVEIVEMEKNLLWRGHKFDRGTDDFEFTIKRGELTQQEIQEFEKALQEKYPDADYKYVKPWEKAQFEVFAKGSEAEMEDENEQLIA